MLPIAPIKATTEPADQSDRQSDLERLNLATASPLWVSVSEAAKMGGVQTKTIRRAIEGGLVKFQIKNNRYLLELGSVFKFLAKSPKLKNKFWSRGVAQYFKSR